MYRYNVHLVDEKEGWIVSFLPGSVDPSWKHLGKTMSGHWYLRR